MSILIAGGLLAFALAAILVAIWLGVSEQRAERARTSSAAAHPAPVAAPVPVPEQPAQVSRPPRSTVQLSQELSTTREKPAPDGQALAKQEELPYFAMNGLIREIAEELRSLHREAWELEQRLRGLTEMFDRTESALGRRPAIDEEVTEEHFPSEAR